MEDAGILEKEERRRTLIVNERAKLAANAFDRLSTASAAAGFIAPVASFSGTGSLSGISLTVVISTMTWLFAAAVLHFVARQLLGKLEA